MFKYPYEPLWRAKGIFRWEPNYHETRTRATWCDDHEICPQLLSRLLVRIPQIPIWRRFSITSGLCIERPLPMASFTLVRANRGWRCWRVIPSRWSPVILIYSLRKPKEMQQDRPPSYGTRRTSTSALLSDTLRGRGGRMSVSTETRAVFRLIAREILCDGARHVSMC